MKVKNKLFYIAKDRSVLNIFDCAILNFFDEVLKYMDDSSCFTECADEILHNYGDYGYKESDIWELYQTIFYPEDEISIDNLVEKLSGLFYNLLNSHRIDTVENDDDI